jgi:hypothetical protein
LVVDITSLVVTSVVVTVAGLSVFIVVAVVALGLMQTVTLVVTLLIVGARDHT